VIKETRLSAMKLVTRRRFISNLSAAAASLALPIGLRASGDFEPKTRLGIAFVGLGNYATNHLAPAARLSKRWRIAGVVTGDRSKGLSWARQDRFPERNVFGYENMAELANRPEIDAVYVVTPNGLHSGHVIAAARAGKHVICEKPMAVSVAECDAMISACKSAGRRLLIGYRLHYEPHNLEFARLARERVFGNFTRITGANAFDMGNDPSAEGSWRLDPKLAGGGPLMDMGVYVINAACMAKLEAAPISVTASFGTVTRPALFSRVEQSVDWTMAFRDGSTAKCATSYSEQISRFRAEGEKGWAQFEDPAFYYDKPLLTTSRGPVELPQVDQQLAQLDAMAEEISTGGDSAAPAEMGRRDVSIIAAIYEAARTGRQATVG
jgi:glucose-fructose oxidoreductase